MTPFTLHSVNWHHCLQWVPLQRTCAYPCVSALDGIAVVGLQAAFTTTMIQYHCQYLCHCMFCLLCTGQIHPHFCWGGHCHTVVAFPIHYSSIPHSLFHAHSFWICDEIRFVYIHVYIEIPKNLSCILDCDNVVWIYCIVMLLLFRNLLLLAAVLGWIWGIPL